MTATEVELHRLELAYADLRVLEPRQVARLSADIADGGQRQPVLVVPRDDRLVLIDGYCRVAALRRLGRDTVLALPLALSERDALLFAYRTHRGRRRSALEDGWLMRELIEQFGLKQAELAKMLSKSESFVSRRLALVVQLPESVQEAVRDGRICAYAAQRSLVPLARANRDHAERMVANLGDLRPTSRQVSALYQAWRAADIETRERIVANPALFLKAQATEDPLPRDRDPAALIAHAVEVIAGACHAARKVIRQQELHLLDEVGRTAVSRAFQEAALAFRSVRGLLSEEGLDA